MSDNLKKYFFLGRPFSPLYATGMKIRQAFYANSIFKSYKLPAHIISVGNLVMGGTGKTPVVRYIAELMQKNGYIPAIISRGYGGKSKESVNIVSDGSRRLLSPEQAGDEPSMLAEMLKGIPVLTGKKKNTSMQICHPKLWK